MAFYMPKGVHRMHATKMDEHKTSSKKTTTPASTTTTTPTKSNAHIETETEIEIEKRMSELERTRPERERKRNESDSIHAFVQHLLCINALCVLAMHPPIGITISLTKNIHTSPCKKNNQSSGDMK